MTNFELLVKSIIELSNLVGYLQTEDGYMPVRVKEGKAWIDKRQVRHLFVPHGGTTIGEGFEPNVKEPTITVTTFDDSPHTYALIDEKLVSYVHQLMKRHGLTLKQRQATVAAMLDCAVVGPGVPDV